MVLDLLFGCGVWHPGIHMFAFSSSTDIYLHFLVPIATKICQHNFHHPFAFSLLWLQLFLDLASPCATGPCLSQLLSEVPSLATHTVTSKELPPSSLLVPP